MKFVSTILMTVTLALTVTFALASHAASHATGASERPSAPITAEAARRDLAALYDGLQSAHYDLYANRTRAEYDAKYESTLASLSEPLTRFELYLALQKFTAFGDIAHARIDFPSEVYNDFRAGGGKTFPIYLRIVDGKAYVSENYSGSSRVQIGDEILAINKVPMQEWLERLSAYLSADTAYMAHSFLEFSFAQYLWAEAGEIDTFDLRVKRRDGKTAKARIPARTRDEIKAAVDAAPEVFELAGFGREASIVGEGIAYLRPGPFYNVENPDRLWDNSDFVAFVDGAFEGFIEGGADTLIIDLRNNPGGDNSFSDPIISWIADEKFRFASKFLIRSSDEAAASNEARLDGDPDAVKGVSGLFANAYDETPRGETFEFEIPFAFPREGARFTGNVYVLINRHSYSNAVSVAAIFQDYGWGTIAGEKTTDMATTFGAMEHFTLPETGFKVGFPKAHIIRPSGDERVDGVTPDMVITTPIVPTPDDVVLNELLAKIDAQDNNQTP